MEKKTWHKRDPFIERESKKYQNPIPSREFIIELMTKKGRPLSRRQLMSYLTLSSAFEKEALRRRLIAMVRSGQLMKTRKGLYSVVKQPELIQGRVIGHKDGYGYVAPEDGTNYIFLSNYQMRQVFDGDWVKVRVVGVGRNNRREGAIAEIVERKFTQIVGRFFVEGGIGFVSPDNHRITQDIIIPPGSEGKAKSEQLVVAEITTWPTTHAQPIGKIVEILGDYMAPGLEIDVAIRTYGLPHEWPEDVLAEVQHLSSEVTDEAKKGRVDLRHLPFVTIDGEDAKDFDDAVYCEVRNKGGWRLYVAIADVGHYVKSGTALDREALERGNSVYFPGRVIPMLPEALSNGLCSLNPLVDRLSMVCDMTFDPSGKIIRYRFYPAVIKSYARLTYKKVARILEAQQGPLSGKEMEVLPYLENLEQLYRVLSRNREERGALSFETSEVKIEFGPKRKIKRLVPVVRNVAHHIIEECMLSANVCAARFLLKHESGGLFRIHDGPKAEKLTDLKVFLGELGLKLGGGDLPQPKDYAALITQISERPDAHMLQTILLRSMSRAFYSPENDGHFGLAFDEYTHFTSPIRRYPDLLVHRAIRAVVEHQQNKSLPDHTALFVLGEHCSMTERRADEATRDVNNWLKCEYMLERVGEVFEGVITGVTGFGLFVELRDIYVEGLVPIHSLSDDYYLFDGVRHRLMGERTHRTFRIGDVLKVQVVRVSLDDKQIDFMVTDADTKK